VNGAERFMAALRREEPDMVPVWELLMNPPSVEKLRPGASYADVAEWLDLDGVTAGEDQRLESLPNGALRDEWGILWRLSEASATYPIGGPIGSEADLDAYEPPDPEAPWRLRSLEELVQRFKGRRAIVFLGHESFEFSHYLVGGMSRLFTLYVKNPRLVKRLTDMISRYKVRVMERAVEAGADVLLTGDDYANKKGPLMSPGQLSEFVLPHLARAVRAAHRLGVPFIKHTDGNLWLIIEEIVDTGIDGLDPLEPVAGMDIGKVKEAYGEKICLVGNVDCSHLLSFGTTDEVVEAVKETIAKASPGGGHILASSNSIHPGVNPDNYLSMVKAARKYGRYPIDPGLIKEYSTRDYAASYF
jgi:uroporphyrinogen decarboxylase